MPLRFSDALRTVRLLPALAAVLWPGPGSCARAEWRLAIGHVAGRARDTHLWFLFERDERMAAAQPALEPSVRATFQRTVAHPRVMRQGFLFARRTATRKCQWATRDLADHQPPCPPDPLSCGFRARGHRSAALLGFGRSSQVWSHIDQGSGRFRSLADPACAFAFAHHFPTVFVGGTVAVPGVAAKQAMDAAVTEMATGCASGILRVLLTCGRLPVRISSVSRKRSCLGLAVVKHRPCARDVIKVS